jgi:type VII secretion-associated serine protease mycosin
VSAVGRRRSGWRHALVVRPLALPLALGLLLATAAPVQGRIAARGAPPDHRADLITNSLITNREWPLAALHVPQAWKWSKGAGVTVAVLDTGVDGRHPDLTGRVIQGPDYTGRTRRPGSPYWGRHGTAMASLIAGHGHGPGRTAGVLGIAPHAKILSIRVTWENDDPERTNNAQVSQTKDAVAKGIRYAVDHGAQIINMSLGGGKVIYNGNPAEAEAVRYALNKGAMLIASAGNDGAGLNRRNYPAAYPGVTAVGAVDKTLRPAKFTNRHDYVSVAAPGVDIVSADAGRSYVQGTGTSPSAAIVAGIAALVRSHCPMLTPEQTRQALEQGATHRPPGGRNTRIGAGVADAVRAIYAGRQLCQTQTAPQPAQTGTESAGVTARTARVSLPLIGVFASGGALLIVSLIMSWRQRARRRRRAEAQYSQYSQYDDAPEISEPYEGRDRRRGAERYRTAERYAADLMPAPVRTAPQVPLGAPVSGRATQMEKAQMDPEKMDQARADRGRTDIPPAWPHIGQAAEPAPREAAPEIVVPRPSPPPPRGHHGTRDTPGHSFGDDPLGTGYIGPVEVSTPLADQSWETVLRARRRRDATAGGAAPPPPPW